MPIFQTAAILPAIFPLLNNLPGAEKDFWVRTATFLPVLVVASIRSRKIDLRDLSEEQLEEIRNNVNLDHGDADEYNLRQRATSLRVARELANRGSSRAQERLDKPDEWVVKKPK